MSLSTVPSCSRGKSVRTTYLLRLSLWAGKQASLFGLTLNSVKKMWSPTFETSSPNVSVLVRTPQSLRILFLVPEQLLTEPPVIFFVSQAPAMSGLTNLTRMSVSTLRSSRIPALLLRVVYRFFRSLLLDVSLDALHLPVRPMSISSLIPFPRQHQST